jgi:hypothetical protein
MQGKSLEVKMANWGDIAGGVNQGIARNVQTISELQRMQHTEQIMEMEKNKLDNWKQKTEQANRPVYVDTFFESHPEIGPALKNLAMSKAEMEGILTPDAQGRKFFRAEVGDKFTKHLWANNTEDVIGAQLQDIGTQKESLKSQLLEAKKPEDAANLKAQLDKATKAYDDLSWQSTTYQKKKENETKITKAILEATNKPSAHHIVEVVSPDGKTAQKFDYDVLTGARKPIGDPYAVRSQVPNVNITGPQEKTGTWSFMGEDPVTKKPILLNSLTGEQKLGEITTGAKPKAAGKESLADKILKRKQGGAGAGKQIDEATATSILQEAGGDKDKARAIAKQRGYAF